MTHDVLRLKIIIRGAVQGVGFRPFVFRLAEELKLKGWVSNTTQGVFIEVEGEKNTLHHFLLRVQNEKPPRAFIQSCEHSFLDAAGFSQFEIRESANEGKISTLVLPDSATCPDCLSEIFDSSNRRYLYPFTNCTNCGPRFTIIQSLPYDRDNTTMKPFTLCKECSLEYHTPANRRFHAQPNACPLCGPHLELWDEQGKKLSSHHTAMQETVTALAEGKVVAVKGLGGFHLMVDAKNEFAVKQLRQRKHREEKPLAVMFPSLESIVHECEVSELEKYLLRSPESPIVLLQKKMNVEQTHISLLVAPRNPYLGAMLPYTPLHHILLHKCGFPVVATSGNLSDEPICIDEHDAVKRLHGIADLFLVHNRPIERHCDDSIVRIVAGREMLMRRARGYAPLPIYIRTENEDTVLAVGAHLKNTIALSNGSNIFISQHIGDLETVQAHNAFKKVIHDFQKMYEAVPQKILCDAHPEYLSTKFAKAAHLPTEEVQHHYAHVASCMAENELHGSVLGVSWDGTGFGLDGTIWGGEFLLTDEHSFRRTATFRTFPLPGGEQAIKQPRRVALGMLYEIFCEKMFEMSELCSLQAFTKEEQKILRQMLVKKIHSPLTSSAGRIFDAVASLIALQQISSYEGQAAIELEYAATLHRNDERYPFAINEQPATNTQRDASLCIDWEPMVHAILSDLANKKTIGYIASKFHNTMADIIVAVAKKTGEQRVVLSGGCFQNVYLLELVVQRLQSENFQPYWHQRVPTNDGGIALGQVYAAMRK